MAVDLPLFLADAKHGFSKCGIGCRGADGRDRHVYAGEPGIANVLNESICQLRTRRRRGIPEAAQAVDDDRFAIDGFRVSDRGLSERESDRGGGATGHE